MASVRAPRASSHPGPWRARSPCWGQQPTQEQDLGRGMESLGQGTGSPEGAVLAQASLGCPQGPDSTGIIYIALGQGLDSEAQSLLN